jgi:FkbM family methyltransferase
MEKQLIYDVGMHHAKDTEFYLRKGFRVVAIEANQALIQQVEKRLANFIADGSLTILYVAIAPEPGEIEFYINKDKDDWSTISKDYVEKNENFGTNHTVVKVKGDTFRNIVSRHGVPYYLKIDIEGADMLCLEDLLTFSVRPKFLSLELALADFDDGFNELATLWKLGYRQFKIMNQAMNVRLKSPNPPREGTYVQYSFDGFTSGLFGEETPGEWLGPEEILLKYRALLKKNRMFGEQSKWHNTKVHRIYERVTGEPVAWYDIHAKLG